MAEEQTNPDQTEETNLEGATDTNPQGSAPVVTEESPAGQTEESPLTQEQVQELRDFQQALQDANITNPRDFASEFTRRSQQLNEATTQNSQYQNALQALSGQVQAQQDPVLAAENALAEAEASFDPDRTREARAQWRAVVLNQQKNEAAQTALLALQRQQQMDEARTYGVQTEQELVPVAQNLTLGDLAAIKRMKEGTLREHLNRRAQAEIDAAARAQRLNTLAGDGTGGAVPGSFNDPNAEQPVNGLHWLALSPAARKRLYGDVQPTIE